jgi:mRNA interferase MazF
MKKDFNKWSELKQRIDNQSRKFYVKPREVVWLSLGENVGDEENGKGEKFARPFLVLKVFNANIFYGVPLSSVIKENNKFYLKIKVKRKFEKTFVTEERSLLLSHGRLLDTKRIFKHHGFLDKEDFIKTKSAISTLLFGFSGSDFSDPRPKPICNTSISNLENKSNENIKIKT